MGQHNIFWEWFEANVDRIEAHQSASEDQSASKDSGVLEEILEQLHYYNDKLYFELSSGPEKEFILTAEGDVDQFVSVNELITRAPDIKSWKFTAFKSGVGFGFSTQYAGVDYDPDELWFLPLSSMSGPDNLALRIGIPNFSEEDPEISEQAMWLILETALGELECAKSIHHVEVGSLPHEPDEMGYIELVELEEFIHWYRDNAGMF